MKMRRHLPLNITVLALAALLWQTEARARDQQSRHGRSNDVRKWRSKRHFDVRVSEHWRLARSRLRDRARIYEPLIRAAAHKHGVDPRVLWTIAFLETRFRPELVSPMKARGLMQFMPETARRFNLSNPHDAAAAIDAAARYVNVLTTRFDGKLELVLAGYNAGEGAVESYRDGRSLRTSKGKVINPRRIKTNGVPPYRETMLYVKRGLLVFNRVTTAGVFSPELIATARPLRVASLTVSLTDQVLIDRELKGLGATPATVLYSEVKQGAIADGPGKGMSVASGKERDATDFETVFFDVHSGARYVVSRGEIIKPLQSLETSEAAGNGGESGHVSKSYYFGAGGN